MLLLSTLALFPTIAVSQIRGSPARDQLGGEDLWHNPTLSHTSGPSRVIMESDSSPPRRKGQYMAGPVLIELDMPADLKRFTLPEGVKQRLQALLDKQDEGEGLTAKERDEAEGLVDLGELLSLLKLRVSRAAEADV